MMVRFIGLVAGLMLATSALAAQDKVAAMAADGSVAKSERQAVLNFARLWIQDPKVTLPVEYCPHEGECKVVNTWNVLLGEGWVQKQMSANVPVLVSPRYDQIKVEGNMVTLVTPQTETTVDGYAVQGPEPYVIPTYLKFKDKFLKSLDALSPTLQAAQAAFNEVRAKNLADKEEGTFMAQQAESAGIPLSVYEKLSQSTFAFGVYLPKITGGITVTQKKVTKLDGSTDWSYSTSMTAPLVPKLLIAQFDGTKFRVAKEEELGGSFMSVLSTVMASGGSVDTDYQPMSSHAQAIFEQVFYTSLRDAFIQLGNNLKADPRFALGAPIMVDAKQRPVIEMGVKEGLRVGHPFRATRMVDGESKDMGYFRVYDIANNCRTPASSVMENRGGTFEEYDLAVEEPYGGFFLGVNPAAGLITGLKVNGVDATDETRMAAGLDFDLQADLGYIANVSALSDWYLHLRLGTLAPMGEWANISDLFLIPTFDLGFEKRIYMGPMYVGIEGDISGQVWYNTYSDDFYTDVTEISSFFGGGLNVAAGMGLGSSLNVSLSLGAKYMTLVNQSFDVGGETIDAGLLDSAEYIYVGGLLTFEFGSNGAGPYAAMYSASKGCKKK